jgi:hypothetical protein
MRNSAAAAITKKRVLRAIFWYRVLKLALQRRQQQVFVRKNKEAFFVGHTLFIQEKISCFFVTYFLYLFLSLLQRSATKKKDAFYTKRSLI